MATEMRALGLQVLDVATEVLPLFLPRGGILADLGWCRFASAPNDSRTADKALEWVDLALAFEPDYADALEVRARILTASPKRKADAIKALRRLLRIRKDSEWGRSELRRLDRDKPDGEDGKKKRGLGRLLGRG